MDFVEYQKLSRKTAFYPDAGKNWIYPTLGLVSEAGEVASKMKKILRDHGGLMNEEQRALVAYEIGDVLWYLAQLATELNLSFEAIAEGNLKKLYSRLRRDVLHGSGDNR